MGIKFTQYSKIRKLFLLCNLRVNELLLPAMHCMVVQQAYSMKYNVALQSSISHFHDCQDDERLTQLLGCQTSKNGVYHFIHVQ
jgi:hypothetical protein